MSKITENGILLAWPVPHLTDADLAWMDDTDQRETIMANYEDWENSRAAVNGLLFPKALTLAQKLTQKAKQL